MRVDAVRVWVGMVGMCAAAAAGAHNMHAMPEPAATSASVAKSLSASACWVRQLPAPLPSGGFLVIHNAGAEPATLKSVQSADYGQVMMHQTTESGGMSSMSMVHDLKVPASGDLKFAPGGYHLMLEHPRADLKVGDVANMVFTLSTGEEFSAACKVEPANAMSADPAAAHAAH
ncbi:MAG TPA: copper chaperone PCu(A)C [Castellaniella sp.]|uniref:copper chaperone PCu(A)C n=1 Tax=Castellaniella sp. TaxID=1955812 RepID=UPI002EF3A63D